jgi:DNA-binding beta-propeller fold protein YncE
VNGDVWVPCDQDGTIWHVSGTTNKVVESLKAGGNPAVVAPVGAEVWATIFDAGSVLRIVPS